jgi:membrane associated rhomboid family serine protease
MTQFSPTPFGSIPLVTKNLLIINVLVYLAQVTLQSAGLVNMEGMFGLHHIQSSLFQPWQTFTYMFLHGGFWHLVANMFGLYMFGSVLEGLWGPKRFLTFYFICGIGAALVQLVFLLNRHQDLLHQFSIVQQHLTPESALQFYKQFGPSESSATVFNKYVQDSHNVVNAQAVLQDIADRKNSYLENATIGASGAVVGILAAFVYLFPNDYLYLYFVIRVKAKWLGLAYFAYELYSAVLDKPTDNVAHWAHIGGGLVGFLLVLTQNRKNRRNFY